jgi:hypothetical protein
MVLINENDSLQGQSDSIITQMHQSQNKNIDGNWMCAVSATAHAAGFVAQWYPIFLEAGLIAAIEHVSMRKRLLVGDFSHIWKLFCNYVENHCAILSPDSLEQFSATSEEFNKLLNLSDVLMDKSSTSEMRDAYTLRLFSLKNCATCFRKA